MSEPRLQALTGADYDEQWRRLDDFIRFNPGARHRRRMVRRLLRGRRYASHLDVGCGSGELILELSRTFGAPPEVWGVDLSAESVRRNSERFPGCHFEVLDITRASLPRTFELVTCCEVIEHVADLPAAIRNLAAMVAPGGLLVLTCPTGPIFPTERGFGHVHHPTAGELGALTRAAGLVQLELLSWGWPTYWLTKCLTNVRPEWSQRNFAAGNYGPFQRAVSGALYLANLANRSSRWGCQLFGLFQRPAGGADAGL